MAGKIIKYDMKAREAMLALPGMGFVTLSVIDAEGRSARSQVRVR